MAEAVLGLAHLLRASEGRAQGGGPRYTFRAGLIRRPSFAQGENPDRKRYIHTKQARETALRELERQDAIRESSQRTHDERDFEELVADRELAV